VFSAALWIKNAIFRQEMMGAHNFNCALNFLQNEDLVPKFYTFKRNFLTG